MGRGGGSLLVAVLACAVAQQAIAANVYVDCDNGDDSAAGTESAPFRTVDKGADVIRNESPAEGERVVYIVGDCYPMKRGETKVRFDLTSVLELNAWNCKHCGTVASPLVFQSWEKDGRKGRLLGGLPLHTSAWVAASSIPSAPNYLSNQVKAIDLTTYDLNGDTSNMWYGSKTAQELTKKMVTKSWPDCMGTQSELFFKGEAMNLARYPNQPKVGEDHYYTSAWENWMALGGEIPGESSTSLWMYPYGDPVLKSDTSGMKAHSNRVHNWAAESNGFVHGYFGNEWADHYVGVTSTQDHTGDDADRAAIKLTLDTMPSYGLESGARFRAVNFLSELDDEGEYYLDADNAVVYFYPPSTMTPGASDEVVLSMLQSVVFYKSSTSNPDGLQHITLRGLDINYARGTGVKWDGTNLNIEECSIVGHTASGASVSGTDNTVSKSTFYSTGCYNLKIEGGDIDKLETSNNVISDNDFGLFGRITRTYQPGIRWGGVGLTVTGNKIHDGPHAGMYGGGNDCVVRNNQFYDVVQEASDMGAFYSGQSWVRRGTLVEANSFVRFKNKVHPFLRHSHVAGVYLDDVQAGYTVKDNTFDDGQFGVLSNGGRDNVIIGNEFKNTETAISWNQAGLDWSFLRERCTYPFAGIYAETPTYVGQLQDSNYQQPPYNKYTGITTTLDNGRSCYPEGNSFTNNKYCDIPDGFEFRNFDDDQLTTWGSTWANNLQGAECDQTVEESTSVTTTPTSAITFGWCTDFGADPGSPGRCEEGNVYAGSTCTPRCNDPGHVPSVASLTCLGENKFEPAGFSCMIPRCDVVAVPNMHPDKCHQPGFGERGLPEGETCTIKCADGYVSGETTQCRLLQGGLATELTKTSYSCKPIDGYCPLGAVDLADPAKNPGFETTDCPATLSLFDSCTVKCKPGLYPTAAQEATLRCQLGGLSLPAPDFKCAPCPAGSWSDGHTCKACAVGTAASIAGSATCSPCAPGRFAAEKGLTNCTHCPAGKHASGTGATACTACSVGSYASLGSTVCTPCNPGSTTSKQGAVVAADCVCRPGHAGNAASTGCSICPIGSWARKGASQCTPCTGNSSTADRGAERPMECKCDEGYMGDFAGCIPFDCESKVTSRTTAYRFTEMSLSAPAFDIDVVCADGYSGIPVVTPCDRPFGPYKLEGCQETFDCVGHWSPCNTDCKRTFIVDREAQAGGAYCNHKDGDTSVCEMGEDECLLPAHLIEATLQVGGGAKRMHR